MHLIENLNDNIKENSTSIDSKDPADMFKKIKNNFKKFSDVDIDCVKVPENSSELFNNTNINIQNLEKDIDLNYIIKDKTEILGRYILR